MSVPQQAFDGRLGITPSAVFDNPDAGQGPVNTGTRWYDRECVPFARSVATWVKVQQWRGPDHQLLENLANMVQTYSAGDVGPVDAGHLRDVLQDGDHTTGVNYIQNFKCQVKTKRMLLERIADAVGYEAGLGEQFVMSRVPSTDIIPSRIARIIKATPHWPRTLDAIRDHVKNLVGPGQSSSSPAPSQNMSAQQQAHYMEVKMLLGARSNLQKSDYFVAEANLQMTAFMLHWHSTRNTPFPRNADIFFQNLADASQDMPYFPIVQQDFTRMSKTERSDLFSTMKTCLDLAVHVSPLVLLRRLPGKDFHLSRPVLIKWGMELGPKPDYIVIAERRMWNMILCIAAGQEASFALQWLVHYCSHEMDALQAKSDDVYGFFANGVLDDKAVGPVDAEPSLAELMETNSSPHEVQAPLDDVVSDAGDAEAPPEPAEAIQELNASSPHVHSEPQSPTSSLPNSPIHAADKSPLSSLSDLSLSDEDESGSEPEPLASTNLTPVIVKSSTRVIKPPKIFTSGIALTQAPSKKRKLETEAPGPITSPLVSTKQEDFFWNSAFTYVSAASYEVPGNEPLAPSPATGKNKKKAPRASKPTKRSDKIVSVPLFNEAERQGPVEYAFQPDEKSAKWDINLVSKIVRMVKSKFGPSGQPPHWEPSASRAELGNGCSSIFVVDCEKFKKMSPMEIQEVHRHRHILVTGVDAGRPIQFDAEGLEMLSDVDAEVQIQHSDKKSRYNSQAMLVPGTLRDLLRNVTEDSPVAMNVLDLPLGQATVPIPPAYVDVSTDAHSVNVVKRLVELQDMSDVTSWGTAATRDADSWFHCDDHGFSTAAWVQTGGKYWVLARRINRNPRVDEMGSHLIFQDWNVEDIDDKLWEAEAVHLDRNCVLYMRPSTPHFVLGTAPTIVLGRHYYATASIRRSCFGIVHTFVMGLGITNTFHTDGTRSMLRQLMALFYRHLILHDGFDRRDAHVPDMRTQDGLLDVIALGCVLEFTTALSRARYAKNYDPGTDEACTDHAQENQARTWFRVLMKVFGTKYAIQFKDKIVHPSYMWHSVLVRFGVSMVNYMRDKAKAVVWGPGMTPAAVKDAVRAHLQEDHPHLLEPFDVAISLDNPGLSMTWDGPDFQIIPKSRSFHALLEALGCHEQRDLDFKLLYPPSALACAPENLNRYYRDVWPGE